MYCLWDERQRRHVLLQACFSYELTHLLTFLSSSTFYSTMAINILLSSRQIRSNSTMPHQGIRYMHSASMVAQYWGALTDTCFLQVALI